MSPISPEPESYWLSLAREGDDAAFEKLAAIHSAKVHAHCYRMLGSLFDADDALQETLVAAWRGLRSFEERSALGTWLYQIATRICLRMIASRPRRLISSDLGPALVSTDDLGVMRSELPWLQPFPDKETFDAEGRLLHREHLHLAFIALLQRLRGTQRAVFLLRDVLHLSAVETAEALGTTVAAANSSLQRARRTLATVRSDTNAEVSPGEGEVRELVREFMVAWENGDVPAMVQLLSHDVRFTMPPLPAWFQGRVAVQRFIVDRLFETPWRVLPLYGNGQPGLACYLRAKGDDKFRPGALVLLSVNDGYITAIDSFLDPALFPRFGMEDEFF